jgi:hypothetical protein
MGFKPIIMNTTENMLSMLFLWERLLILNLSIIYGDYLIVYFRKRSENYLILKLIILKSFCD